MSEEATNPETETTDERTDAADAGEATDADQAAVAEDGAGQGENTAAETDTTTAAAEPPPAAGEDRGSVRAADVRREPEPTPAERELAELTAKIEADDFDGYGKEGKRAILRRQDLAAQVAAEAPARRAQQAQEQAQNYWANWTRGDDLARKQFGAKVAPARARELFDQTMREIAANPRYANRKEMDLNSVAYDRWLDALEAESKKPAPAAKPAAAKAGTRVSGSGTTAQPAPSNKTARQKLQDGDYELAGDARRLGML